MLVERYLHHLEVDGLTPLQIVAVTFTEAAAAELRARIRRKVAGKYPKGDDRVAELEAARIGTIHSLAAAICRQHPEAAQVPPDFTILDDLQGPIWIAERIDDALDGIDPDLMLAIPFTRVRSAIKALMSDPSTASLALTMDIRTSIEKYLSEACATISSTAAWKEARGVVMSETGPASDKIEQVRRITLEVMFGIEAASDPILFVLRSKEINLTGGAPTVWGADRLKEVKAAITTIRDCIKSAFKPVFNLESSTDLSDLNDIIPTLRTAYEQVQTALQSAKRQRRLLDYNDLEIHALRALQMKDVQTFYHKRWRAFLLDEFQDTNPIQAEILRALLSGGARSVLVGDKNQSIYGFRRAEPALFARFEENILAGGGTSSVLDTNYRSHPELIDRFNGLFSSLIDQDLGPKDYLAQNARQLHDCELSRRAKMGRVRYFAVRPPGEGEGKATTGQIRRIEAVHIARFLTELRGSKTQILDPETKVMRAVEWRDMAILARTGSTLDTLSEALGGAGVPHVNAGGGSLLQTREAKDGAVLLRFLADPKDNLALAAVLRSPFCSVSDRTLYHIAKSKPSCLWDHLSVTRPPEIERALGFLELLLAARARELPSRLLRLADVKSGYSAILANLASSRRRSADWLGFLDLVTRIEMETGDVFAVSRTLLRIAQAELSRDSNVRVSRPSLEAGDAVSLMSIHKSKGLEWPVVVVADLARSTPNNPGPLLFDKDLGVGLQLKGESGAAGLLHGIINQRLQERELAEEKRVLYVACTRARDYLILSASGGSRSFPPTTPLSDALLVNEIPLEVVPFSRQDAFPPASEQKVPPIDAARRVLGAITVPPAELPVTSIGDYLDCPKKFHYRHILGHRGLGEGDRKAAKIGTLVHLAIEHGWKDLDDLRRAAPDLLSEEYEAALAMANSFRENPVFAQFREVSSRYEVPIRLDIAGTSLTGRIDLLGKDQIADFKTDTGSGKWRHRMQLWAYSEATGIRNAFVIHLRGETVEAIEVRDLKQAGAAVHETLEKIAANEYGATPDEVRCRRCAFNRICPESYVPIAQQ